MKQKDKKVWTPYVMVFPAFAVMMLVVVLPIINTILQSFQTVDGTFTMANYQYFFTSKEAFQSLIFTAIEAFSTMLLAIIFSFLLALYLRFSKSKISRFIGRLYLLPRFIPGIVAVYAVMNIIKDAGFINRFLQLFGIAYKPGLLYDMKGIILCNLWFNIHFLRCCSQQHYQQWQILMWKVQGMQVVLIGRFFKRLYGRLYTKM